MADSKPGSNDHTPSDEMTEELVAYLDGELDPTEADAMAARLGLDAKLRSRADAFQRTWDILDILPRPQPSATFASRTVSQLMAVPSTGSSLQATAALPSSANATMPAYMPPRSNAGFWLVSTLLILAAAFGGYFGHQIYFPPPKPPEVNPPLEDVPLMKNLRLYRDVEDMEYLKRLDSPDMFGDSSE